jgi:hypothetical protein
MVLNLKADSVGLGEIWVINDEDPAKIDQRVCEAPPNSI